MSWKKCLLVICKVLRIFLNILAGDDKYFLVNRGNLRQPIQMRLSQKQKTSSEFASVFFKFILNFEHFRKVEDPHRSSISEITDSKNVPKQISKKSPFRRPFDKQHAKLDQTLLRSERYHVYHIY